MTAYLPAVTATLPGVAYVLLALRERRRHGWHGGPLVAFVTGTATAVLAVTPAFDAWAEADFGGHVAQHLLLGMVAPLGLVLGSPVTLLLRALPHRHGRRLGGLLRGPAVRALTRPAVAVAASSGGLVLLYLTPLYGLSTRHEGVHLLVHVHLVLAGTLLVTWRPAAAGPTGRRLRGASVP